MDYNHVYKKVEHYVVGLYEKNLNPNLLYHNLEHTRGVVSRTKEIAGHYDLSERNTLIVYVAAWFHDAGYLYTEPAWHEEKSCELMRKSMVELGVENDVIEETEECIMATKFSAQPSNLCQEILKDADTYHLGTKEFKRINKLVFAEFSLTDPTFNKTEAIKSAVTMLEKHKYYTSYCRELLTETKRKNMSKLKKKLMDDEEEAAKEEIKKMQLGGEKSALVTKGIQTMLRLTSENQMKLSDMADNKANILISVNAIIISVIFAVLLRRLQYETYLTIPTVIFLVVSVVTIVISILATRPKLSSGTFSEQDIINKKTNLLFFGNFHKASFEQYESAMIKMMKDPDYLYRSVVKDIYYLAVVLGRKYRLIRLAYNIFMVGIIVSVLAFGIATFFFSKGTTVITNAQGTPL
jgi:HD superfamily phosphodiesterase